MQYVVELQEEGWYVVYSDTSERTMTGSMAYEIQGMQSWLIRNDYDNWLDKNLSPLREDPRVRWNGRFWHAREGDV